MKIEKLRKLYLEAALENDTKKQIKLRKKLFSKILKKNKRNRGNFKFSPKWII